MQSDDEPMDPEVLKALKNCSISDELANADFSKKDKKNKNTKKNKKTNNKKGQDFLDFAQEKGIELKIQYEDKEDAKKTFYQKDNNNLNFKGKPYQKNNDYQNNNPNNFKNKNHQGKNFKFPKKNFHFQNKSKNNKFDQVNMMYNPLMFNQMRSGMMNPYQMPNYHMGQNPQNFHQMDMNNQDPFFNSERTVEEILAYIFSPEFLNKEVYFRKRIEDDGSIDLNHVLNYNK
jgi:hypothetical protein